MSGYKIIAFAICLSANLVGVNTLLAAPGELISDFRTLSEIPPSETKAKGTDKNTKLASYSLDLKWNESGKKFVVPVSNSGSQAVDIVGVQVTGGLYVCKLPEKIPAGGVAKVVLLLVAGEGSSNTMDILRVLTTGGEQVIQIDHDREVAVSLGQKVLNWNVGDPVTAKDVTAEIKIPGIKIVSVRAAGKGNEATVADLGNGTYKITVTPGDLGRRNSFPVFLQMEPRLPGVSSVIAGEVVEKL